MPRMMKAGLGIARLAASSEAVANTPYTGKFHGKVHDASRRVTVYQQADGKLLLRLTGFKASDGPDVHVLLVKADDQALEQVVVKGRLDHVEWGALKGNQGGSER